MLGVIAAVWIGERRWRARGGEPGTITDLAVWAVPFGLVGGRLYHVITDWQLYFAENAPNRPIDALYIWHGGLGIWGAIALGAVGVWIACRRRGISLAAVADTVAPGIAVAQAIGRWGNYFNQELFGGPTDLPWGLEIDPGRPGTIPGVSTYHPAFLYESLWDLALAGVLIWAGKRYGLRHARLFALYVAGYTLGRFWIEGMRVDPAHHILGLRLNQWTSLIIFVGALLYMWLTRNKTGEEIVSPGGGAASDPAHPADQADEHETAGDAAEAVRPLATTDAAESEEPSAGAERAGGTEDADPAHGAKEADPEERAAASEPTGRTESAEAAAEPEPSEASGETTAPGSGDNAEDKGATDGGAGAEAADAAPKGGDAPGKTQTPPTAVPDSEANTR
ncbi:prolipoprotein diacylglyceryl transferase [Sphaerisporangium fuscum]|uniref:prolipoprotein diacylglyceryl transferase n=1 Tax=Sphaerisporangium fuscum TaxID=2835868 RepID=UPI00355702E4